MSFLRPLSVGFALTLAAFDQEATPAPAPAPAPAPDPVEGVWLGTVTTPEDEAKDFGLQFTRANKGPCAGATADLLRS